MSNTTHFNLAKPAQTDGFDIDTQNGNMDIVDEEMYKPPLTVNEIEPDPITRDIHVDEVPLAQNLSSDIAQLNNGDFIERTSGGDASIEDGYASLVSIKGAMVKTGYVPEELTMTVTPAERETGDPITATLDRATFISAVSSSGTTTLTYTTAWSANPATYGVTVTGTPINGDVITIEYVKEDRGTITAANPTAFNSTGWNLYDNVTGYAKVVAYSEEYGYLLGGTYSIVEFSETLTGTKSAVSVVNGYFTVPSDGFVWITGGDATTYILATWSDWIEGYQGSFQAYTVDTISLSEVMLNFPYGLLAVGNVRDEININSQRAINRIERMTYSAENLASVVESGVAYDTDENYIYAVLETPVSTAIDLDGAYTVSDHGIEFFSGTTVALITETLYGENLKDKLRTDVLTISEQELTAAQQTQVLANIGATAKLAEKARFIFLSTADNTWAKIWAKINTLATGETCCMVATGTAMPIISGNVRSSGLYGAFCRISSNVFDMIGKDASNNVVAFRLTSATSSGCTYAEKEMVLRSDFEFATGTAISIASYGVSAVGNGYIGNGGKSIYLNIPMGKNFTSGTFTFTSLVVTVRGVSGIVDDLSSTELVGNTSYSFTSARTNYGSSLSITITKSTAVGTNGTPVSCSVSGSMTNG